MRLLILACSASKVPHEALLPAWRRYAGPSYRTLRRWLREAPAQLGVDLDLAILSARYGLIAWDQPIPAYDERMDCQRAAAHRAQVEQEVRRFWCALGPPTGRRYPRRSCAGRLARAAGSERRSASSGAGCGTR